MNLNVPTAFHFLEFRMAGDVHFDDMEGMFGTLQQQAHSDDRIWSKLGSPKSQYINGWLKTIKHVVVYDIVSWLSVQSTVIPILNATQLIFTLIVKLNKVNI